MADKGKFLDFLDMIDGGGAGAMGDKFEGGGIFSMLANALATPYGSEDEMRKAERMKAFGLLSDQGQVGGGAFTPAPQTKPSPAPSYANMPMGEAGRGAPAQPAAPAYATMDVGEVGRGVAPNPLANMPATDAMAMMRNAPNQQTVPFGGFQQSTPYTDMMDRMREMGIDVNSMSAEQLQNLMTMYMRGGPMNYGMGR